MKYREIEARYRFYNVLLLIGFAALILLSLVMCSRAQAETLQMATPYAEDVFHTKNIRLFADEVASFSDNTIKIDVHTGGKRYKASQITNAVMMHMQTQIHLGETLLSSTEEIQFTAADAIPFVARNYADAKRLYGYQRELLSRSLSELGLKLLYCVPWPPQGLYTKTPVKGWRDLRGMDMRYNNEWTKNIALHARANPVWVENTEINKALKSGEINSMITSPVSGVSGRVWEHLKFFYPINAWLPKNAVFIAEQTFDRLTDNQKKALLNAAAMAETRGWEMSAQMMRDSIETLRKNGMVIGEVSYDLDDELTKLGDRFALQWVKKEGNEANDIFIPYFTEALKD